MGPFVHHGIHVQLLRWQLLDCTAAQPRPGRCRPAGTAALGSPSGSRTFRGRGDGPACLACLVSSDTIDFLFWRPGTSRELSRPRCLPPAGGSWCRRSAPRPPSPGTPRCRAAFLREKTRREGGGGLGGGGLGAKRATSLAEQQGKNVDARGGVGCRAQGWNMSLMCACFCGCVVLGIHGPPLRVISLREHSGWGFLGL